MRTTIADVAARAGVSKMTVSNVLNNRRARVGEPTRQRVLTLIDEMSYVPVRFATQNRPTETKVLGVVLGEIGKLPVLQGLQAGAAKHGYDVLLLLRPTDECFLDREEARFLDRRCDGYLFMTHYPIRVLRSLAGHGTRMAACFSTDVPAGVPWITPDNRAAMALAVEHLHAHGHRRIAHVAGPLTHTEARQRVDGFKSALVDHGLEARDDLIIPGGTWGDQLPPDTLDRVLATGATAVACANDAIALELWRRCEARGMSVPRDLSLTGMDNLPEAVRRSLTSVENPVERIVLTALDTLVQVIRGTGDAVNASVPVKLIERASACAPASARQPAFRVG